MKKPSINGRITPDELRRMLAYNPDTGAMTWRTRPASDFRATGGADAQTTARRWNGKNAGKPALTSGSRYLSGTINGMNARAHWVAWMMYYGVPPVYEIDHINGDGKDNRIANLRDVPRSINHRNRPQAKETASGRTGVSWDATRKKWTARIKVEGITKNLGRFDLVSDAISARVAAEQGLDFTERHATPGGSA